jgi:AcrR family transcriptional regulator
MNVQPAARTDVRGEILTVATRLFARQGFDGTSIAEIADAVGVKKPSLLYHFASKEELRQAVLDNVLARWNETLPRVLVAATAGEDQFEGVTRELVSFFMADPDRARLLIREALDRPDDMRKRLAAHVRPVVANLSDYIRRGQGHGELHAEADAEAYLFQTITLLLCGVAFTDSFGTLMPKSSPYGGQKERLTRELLRIARSGLFLPPGAEASGVTKTRGVGKKKKKD